MSRFGILYPNGSQTATFGSWVLRNNRSKLTLFSPGDPYKDQTKNLVLDLAIQGVEQARLGDLPNTNFEILAYPNLSECEFLVVPNLDILPHNMDDVDYVTFCMNTFTHLKHDVQFMDDVRVLFGRNVSGLIAAMAWGEHWPDMRKNIYITSSIFTASEKVFGNDNMAVPLKRREPDLIYSKDGVQTDIVKKMACSWGLNDFTSIETTALTSLAQSLQIGQLERLKVIGRFPTTQEGEEHNLMVDVPAFLPVDFNVDYDLYNDRVIEQVRVNSLWMKSCLEEHYN